VRLSTLDGLRGVVVACVCVCVGVVAWNPRPALADDGTNPNYPGSTLHIAVRQIAATEALVTATGTNVPLTLEGQPTLNDFELQLFEDNETLLPFPCYQDYGDELNTAVNNDRAVIDLTQGTVSEGDGGPFTISMPVPLYATGPVRFCAYNSDNFTDTTAWSTADITVGSGSPGASARPAASTRPRVTRSGRLLRCSPGRWSGNPTSYRYRWVVVHKAGVAGRETSLTVTRRLRGHKVECSVTANNSAGSATATSLPFAVA
jgi:hypothetical protein